MVKESAIRAQNWDKFRNWRQEDGIVGQQIDMTAAKVFGDGNARRCCLIFDIRCTTLGQEQKLECYCPNSIPASNSSYDEAMNLIGWRMAPTPIQSGGSYYINSFHQGACIRPHILVMIDKYTDLGNGFAEVLTAQSPKAKKPWKNIKPQQVRIPIKWILPVIGSTSMLPFVLSPRGPQRAILPVGSYGKLQDHEGAMQIQGWGKLNELFQEPSKSGRSTPNTLIANLDYKSKLNRQLPLFHDEKLLLSRVLYAGYGDIMRGCRIPLSSSVIHETLYHSSFEKPEEAAYLVALLNAPSLLQAFKGSQTSGHGFHLQPWRRVPIPKYEPHNNLHRELVNLTTEAEVTAQELLNELIREKGKVAQLSGQKALSKRIRARLVENRISGRIDEVVAKLLPEQVR